MSLPPNATPLDILAQAAAITAYMDKVKERLGDGSQKHIEFLQNVQNFRGNRENLPKSIAIMTIFLDDHQDLIDGLEKFLPEGYHMHPNPFRVSWMQFEWQVKTTYAREPKVYQNFVDLCSQWWFRGSTTSEFQQRIEKLFEDRQELVERLKIFVQIGNLPNLVVTGPDGNRTNPKIG